MDWLTPQNTPLRTDCECIRRTLSESRVRENRMHGLMRGAGINPCLYSTVLFFHEDFRIRGLEGLDSLRITRIQQIEQIELICDLSFVSIRGRKSC